MLTFAEIDRVAGNRIGQFDAPCPACGPGRRLVKNRRRRVLRVWRRDQSFASFNCMRCGVKGHVHDHAAPIDRTQMDRVRAKSAQQDQIIAADKLRSARKLWASRLPIAGSLAETYLREARGFTGVIPATLGYLPARNDYPAAMIAAFGFADEHDPGTLAMNPNAVTSVHLTRLKPDGSGKAGSYTDKIMLGRSLGSPIVLAPPNDLLGLAITEGIEDALSVHQATGLGVWAAGCASPLPALAQAIPDYIECCTIIVNDDDAGQRYAAELADLLSNRMEVLVEGPSQ